MTPSILGWDFDVSRRVGLLQSYHRGAGQQESIHIAITEIVLTMEASSIHQLQQLAEVIEQAKSRRDLALTNYDHARFEHLRAEARRKAGVRDGLPAVVVESGTGRANLALGVEGVKALQAELNTADQALAHALAQFDPRSALAHPRCAVPQPVRDRDGQHDRQCGAAHPRA